MQGKNKTFFHVSNDLKRARSIRGYLYVVRNLLSEERKAQNRIGIAGADPNIF